MRAYRSFSWAGILGMAMLLSGCEASVPSQVHIGKIRIKEQVVTETLDADYVDPARVHVLAKTIKNNGKQGGEVTLTVPYLAGSAAYVTAAEKQGQSYKKALAAEGVENISVVTVPVLEKRYTGEIVASYRALTALPPKDCGTLPGHLGTEDINAVDQYQFGCDTRAALSRMVVDTSDLKGKSGSQDNDSRRTGAMLENYKTGKPNEQMQGFQASNIGGQ